MSGAPRSSAPVVVLDDRYEGAARGLVAAVDGAALDLDVEEVKPVRPRREGIEEARDVPPRSVATFWFRTSSTAAKSG